MVKAQTCAPATLTLTTQSATPAHVAVALLGSDGTLLWLLPQGDAPSVAVGPMAATTVSLKKAVPGPARLLVVRSRDAIDKATARARIEAHVAGTKATTSPNSSW